MLRSISIQKFNEFTEVDKNFWLSACECQYQNIASILRDNIDMVNWQDPVNGMSALHFACKFGDTALIKLLAGTYKADVNIINYAGKTPLHVCVQFDRLECAKLLKGTYNASAEISDYSGHMPIHYATSGNYPSYITFLGTKKGFNRNVVEKKNSRSFDNLAPIMLVRRSHSKDDISSVITPELRKTLSRMSKDNRSAIYMNEIEELAVDTDQLNTF